MFLSRKLLVDLGSGEAEEPCPFPEDGNAEIFRSEDGTRVIYRRLAGKGEGEVIPPDDDGILLGKMRLTVSQNGGESRVVMRSSDGKRFFWSVLLELCESRRFNTDPPWIDWRGRKE